MIRCVKCEKYQHSACYTYDLDSCNAHHCGQCSTDLGFPIVDIAIRAMYDGSMGNAEDQHSAKKCFLVKRASLALYRDEHCDEMSNEGGEGGEGGED